MKRFIPHLAIIIILTICVGIIPMHTAHATIITKITADVASWLLAPVVNAALEVASWLVSFTGMLLDVSINFTLHIKDFVAATPAIYVIWKTIRDISGIFFIFFLLFAAIKMILGMDAGFGNMIKNIVIAGILINFSFFITGVLIDASNVVSLALYQAMLPNAPSDPLTSTSDLTEITATLTGFNKTNQTLTKKLGLSTIFMNSLKVQTLYDSETGKKDIKNISSPVRTIIIGFLGIGMMIMASISFALAAVAFVFRLIILLFLLAFSPIWIAARVIPQLKSHAKSFQDQLVAQLTFMPVYLLLMYAALSVLNNSKIFGNSYSPNLDSPGSGLDVSWAFGFIVMGINFAMVIFMLNLPLVVAMKMGGSAYKWIDTKKWGGEGLWKKWGRNAGSRTFGRAAYSLNESGAMRSLASRSPLLGGLASKGLSSVSKAGFGDKKASYDEILKAKKKDQEALHKRIGDIDRSKYSSEAAYNIAKENAAKQQTSYRQRLPWNNSVLAFMLDNRANKQSALSLKEEADLETNREALREVEKKLKNPLLKATYSTSEIDNMEREQKELAGAVQRASGKKADKERKKLAADIAEGVKEEGGGGGKKNKGEETKPEDKT